MGPHCFCSDARKDSDLSDDDFWYPCPSPSPSIKSSEPLPTISLPTLEDIPQSARQRCKAAKRRSSVSSPSTTHIPRPRNAYVLYRSWALSHHPSIADSRATNRQDVLSKITGELWNTESNEIRAHFAMLAVEEKENHARKYPEYSYVPKLVDRKRGAKKGVRTNVSLVKEKVRADDDVYISIAHCRPAVRTSHRHTPYTTPTSKAKSSSDQLSSPPSASKISLEERRTATASRMTTSRHAVDEASSNRSDGTSQHARPASFPSYLVPPISPSATSSVSSQLSQARRIYFSRLTLSLI